MTVRSLELYPIHLGRAGTAIPQPEFAGFEWYEGYDQRHGGDGADGRLVSMHSFDDSWTSWEMHPSGEEVVICISGHITLLQETPDGSERRIELGPSDYAINGPGVWHTADVQAPATALFITVGEGTSHKPR